MQEYLRKLLLQVTVVVVPTAVSVVVVGTVVNAGIGIQYDNKILRKLLDI